MRQFKSECTCVYLMCGQERCFSNWSGRAIRAATQSHRTRPELVTTAAVGRDHLSLAGRPRSQKQPGRPRRVCSGHEAARFGDVAADSNRASHVWTEERVSGSVTRRGQILGDGSAALRARLIKLATSGPGALLIQTPPGAE